MQIVPTKAVPSQTLQVQLNQQAVSLNIYQMPYGLFVDVYVNNALVIGGVLAHNLDRIVRDAYLGLVGDFTFIDTQANNGVPGDDPIYTGLGDRFQLVYLDEDDLANPSIVETVAAG